VLQVKSFCEALRQARCFTAMLTLETMLRRWNVETMSVRPELRMIGHTGFLTFARKVQPAGLQSTDETTEIEAVEEIADDIVAPGDLTESEL
jgi:tRNA (adenine57-N1/adenine58-N1)-methyltransferase